MKRDTLRTESETSHSTITCGFSLRLRSKTMRNGTPPYWRFLRMVSLESNFPRRARLREEALLEAVLDVAHTRLLRRLAQELLEPPGVGLEERAGERRELGARLLQALLQLVEEALELLLAHLERARGRRGELLDG